MSTHAQKENVVVATNSKVSFYSEAPLENIEAFNKSVKGALNYLTGEIMFIIPISGFEFDKKLMQQHFNKQYLESDKYPEAKFSGFLLDWSGIPASETEFYVKGKMYIHGVTRDVKEKATLKPAGGGVSGYSKILVRIADYNVKVPKMVIKNIAEEVEVEIKADFRPVE